MPFQHEIMADYFSGGVFFHPLHTFFICGHSPSSKLEPLMWSDLISIFDERSHQEARLFENSLRKFEECDTVLGKNIWTCENIIDNYVRERQRRLFKNPFQSSRYDICTANIKQLLQRIKMTGDYSTMRQLVKEIDNAIDNFSQRWFDFTHENLYVTFHKCMNVIRKVIIYTMKLSRQGKIAVHKNNNLIPNSHLQDSFKAYC